MAIARNGRVVCGTRDSAGAHERRDRLGVAKTKRNAGKSRRVDGLRDADGRVFRAANTRKGQDMRDGHA